jgi:hypothetical protein
LVWERCWNFADRRRLNAINRRQLVTCQIPYFPLAPTLIPSPREKLRQDPGF